MKIIKEIGKDEYQVLFSADVNLIDIYFKNRLYNKYYGWLGMPKWFISNNNKIMDI